MFHHDVGKQASGISVVVQMVAQLPANGCWTRLVLRSLVFTSFLLNLMVVWCVCTA